MIVTKLAGMPLPATRRRETPWQMHCKPAQSGVYRRYLPGMGIRFSYYEASKKLWIIGALTAKAAHAHARLSSVFQNAPWCGLSEDPDAR